MPALLYVAHAQPDGALFSSVLSRSVAAKVSTCSVCERTGWWGYLLSCHRPQNCTYSMSQEIGLSPCVHFSPVGNELYQQWAKCLKGEDSINGYPVFHTVAVCHVLAVFSLLYFLVSSLLQESLLLSSRKRLTSRLRMIFLNHFVQTSSVYRLFFPFFSGCQTCRSPWPHYVSRPCGCRWTSHNPSLLFRLMWIARQARRCLPVCCCLNSPATTTTVMLKRQICRLKCVLR